MSQGFVFVASKRGGIIATYADTAPTNQIAPDLPAELAAVDDESEQLEPLQLEPLQLEPLQQATLITTTLTTEALKRHKRFFSETQ